VTLAQTWLRRAIEATGASLLAPVAILLAAGVLAAGGGFGGLSELGQIASGPELPGPDLTQGGSAIEEADIVGADVSTPPAVAATQPGVPAGAPGSPAAEPEVGGVPSPLIDVPSGPGGGGAPPAGTETPPVQSPGAGAPAAPIPEQVQAPAEGVRPLVPEPVQPVTEELLNLLLGPQP
jgi:hypothetical protein